MFEMRYDMKKKGIIAVVLLAFSVALFARFLPDRPSAGMLVEVQDRSAAEAGDFARRALEFARRNDRGNFAAVCADPRDPDLARQYAVLRRTRLAASPSWKVQKPDSEDNLYLVLVETENGGAYRCAVSRDRAHGEWKFAGLYDE